MLSNIDHKYVEAFAIGSFEKVSEIDATDLEDAFTIGNIGPEEKIKRFCSMRSVSVGDIIKDLKDNYHAVAPSGFEMITV